MQFKLSDLIKRCLVILSLGGCGVAFAAEQAKLLSFGIVPQQSAAKLAEEWGPLLAEVGRRAGVKIVFRTAPNIPEFEKRLARGEYDFAYMNPYHYVVFHQGEGYQAFAKEKDRKIKGILVVRKESAYRNLTDLSGKTVVFPAPAAFAASILPQAELGRMNIDFTAKFVASHESVYLAVASGLQEAGGGIQRTFEASPEAVRGALRVIAETPAYTPHAFAAHPRVAAQVIDSVRNAMESLSADEAGKSLLLPLAFKGFVAAQNRDWDDIRQLDIQLLKRYSQQ